MIKKEEIWQSIKLFQKQSRNQLDQTRESEDQSSFISDNEKENLFKNKQQQCQCKQQMLQLKKECLLQIREIKAQHQIELDSVHKLYQKQLNDQKSKYESELQQLKEDIEFYANDSNEKELLQLFEQEQMRDKEIFQQQLELQITEKLKLEQKLIQCQKELKAKESNLQFSVHKNCAPQLFRDTNRKVKMQTETYDRSNVNEQDKTGFCNSIKNFNATIKLMEKSQHN